jgi:GntR family transcriptional regulator
MKELQIKEDTCGETEASILNVASGSPLRRISRVMYTDNRPIAFLVDTLPAEMLPSDEFETGFTGSVLDRLLQQGNPKLSLSRTDIKAVGATPEVARALQIQRDDVLLHFEAQLYCEDGRVVDHSNSYFLPGYFRFHVVRRVG